MSLSRYTVSSKKIFSFFIRIMKQRPKISLKRLLQNTINLTNIIKQGILIKELVDVSLLFQQNNSQSFFFLFILKVFDVLTSLNSVIKFSYYNYSDTQEIIRKSITRMCDHNSNSCYHIYSTTDNKREKNTELTT